MSTPISDRGVAEGGSGTVASADEPGDVTLNFEFETGRTGGGGGRCKKEMRTVADSE